MVRTEDINSTGPEKGFGNPKLLEGGPLDGRRYAIFLC
jgi:hypothetical protein